MRTLPFTGLLTAAALLAAPILVAPVAHATPSETVSPTGYTSDGSGSTNAEAAPSSLGAPDDPEHLPGEAGYGDLVPADLTVPAGSPGADPEATPGPDGRVPHVCAGRKLLHHAHVDAAYVTRVDQTFTVTVVDGRKVVKDPNSVCVRLAPDARSSDSQEVSRMVVPSDGLFDFIGKPGDIVWRAPQEQIDNWRPVWAGIGAFDTAHEVAQPEGILLDEVKLSIANSSGPGAVEVWRTVGTNSLTRGLSSDPSLAPLSLQAGSHGHWNWTFSKAGVYRLDMVASYTSTLSQRAVNSLPSTITWLVGSDDEVGLPEGTTTSLTPIRTTAEQVKEKMIASGELSTEETPAEPEPPFTQAEARKQIEALFGSAAKAPASPSSPSHYVYKGTFTDDVRAGVPIKRVTLDVSANGTSIPGEPILEIPDSLKQTTADGDRWVLPTSGEHGSLGFDFTGMPAELRSEPAVYSVDTFDGPKGGRYIAGTVTDGAMNVTLDTTRDPNRGFTVDAVAVPLAHVFTKPGVYTVGFNIETRDKDGNFSYKSRSAHFVVGDAAISALRAITAENNGEAPSPSPSPNPADPGADAPPSGGAQPGNPSTPDPANPSTPSRPGDSAIHIITEGHMDQAMSLKDGKAEVFVDDTADPRHPVHRASGTFAYAVPDSTHAKIPAGAKGYSELAAAAPEGVWSLPETQLEGIPWVGFSTQRVDYSQLSSKGVEVAMRNFTGPGRLVTGVSSLFEGFTPRLDSTKPDMVLRYLFGSHDHQAFYFTKPGRYSTDFVFTAHLADGSTIEKTLHAIFLVGDEAIKRGAEPDPAPAPNPEPAPSPEPGAPLPIDELVAKLNAESHRNWTNPNTGTHRPSQPAPGTSPSPGSPSTGSHSASASTPDSPIGNPTAAGARLGEGAGQTGTPVTGGSTVSGSLLSSNSAAGAGAASSDSDASGASSADGSQSSGVEGLDFADSAQSGGSTTRALTKPAAPVSALLNPERGSASYGSGSDWWQWVLVGICGSGLVGAGAWALLLRRRASVGK